MIEENYFHMILLLTQILFYINHNRSTVKNLCS